LVAVMLTREEKLKILLERIGTYVTEDIRKEKIWQDWIAGGKYFYFLMDSEYIDKHHSLSIFFYPKSMDKWHLKIIMKETVNTEENLRTLLDFDFLGHEDDCIKKIKRIPVWWKIVDCIDNMCQTRLDQNPKYRTIQHLWALEGKLGDEERSQEFLDRWYNPEIKAKHEEWKKRNQHWIEKNKEEKKTARDEKWAKRQPANRKKFTILDDTEDAKFEEFRRKLHPAEYAARDAMFKKEENETN